VDKKGQLNFKSDYFNLDENRAEEVFGGMREISELCNFFQ
jgi:hypothetical protein